MPFVKFTTDLIQDPEFSGTFGIYKVGLGKEFLTIERPPRQLCHLKHGFNIDAQFIEIAAKVSVAVDITVFGDQMVGSTSDEEGGSPNIGAHPIYRLGKEGSSKRYSNLGIPNKGETEEQRVEKYDEVPYSKHIELLKLTLGKDAVDTRAMLAADIWRYGKYLENGGFLTEAYMSWIKVMELFVSKPISSTRRARAFLTPLNMEVKKEEVGKRLVKINKYRNDYLGHLRNNPMEREAVAKLEAILGAGYYDMLNNFFWDSIQKSLREEDWHHIDVKIIEVLSRLCVLQLGYNVPCKLVKTHHGHSLDILPL